MQPVSALVFDPVTYFSHPVSRTVAGCANTVYVISSIVFAILNRAGLELIFLTQMCISVARSTVSTAACESLNVTCDYK